MILIQQSPVLNSNLYFVLLDKFNQNKIQTRNNDKKGCGLVVRVIKRKISRLYSNYENGFKTTNILLSNLSIINLGISINQGSVKNYMDSIFHQNL